MGIEMSLVEAISIKVETFIAVWSFRASSLKSNPLFGKLPNVDKRVKDRLTHSEAKSCKSIALIFSNGSSPKTVDWNNDSERIDEIRWLIVGVL